MDNYYITTDNLIGTIASAILHLKKIKDGKDLEDDTDFFIKLVDFIEKANKFDYEKLLFDKYFIVSEPVLKNIHMEFNESKISEKIDFEQFKIILKRIDKETEIPIIDQAMNRFKEIAMILLQTKMSEQILM